MFETAAPGVANPDKLVASDPPAIRVSRGDRRDQHRRGEVGIESGYLPPEHSRPQVEEGRPAAAGAQPRPGEAGTWVDLGDGFVIVRYRRKAWVGFMHGGPPGEGVVRSLNRYEPLAEDVDAAGSLGDAAGVRV